MNECAIWACVESFREDEHVLLRSIVWVMAVPTALLDAEAISALPSALIARGLPLVLG